MYLKTLGAGFGAEWGKRRIVLGTYVLPPALRRLLSKPKVSGADCPGISALLHKVDTIVPPTLSRFPALIWEADERPIAVYLADIYTVINGSSGRGSRFLALRHDLSGTASRLQICGPPFGRGASLQVAQAFEELAGPPFSDWWGISRIRHFRPASLDRIL